MSAINLRTEIPGPQSRALMKRREAAVPRGTAHSVPVFAASADGARVTDVDGNVYLDFAGGIGVMNVGHSTPSVLAALHGQVDRFTHVGFSVLPYESYVALAERLAKLSPGSFAKKTLFVNSGAEAIENAVKIARHATGRPGVLCFEDGFHGRTLLALSLTSKVTPYKVGFAPFVTGVMRVPYGYCYRCAYSAEFPSCEFACVDEIERQFKRHADPRSIAAVVVEPVLGEGGFVVPPRGYLSRLAALCRRHGILLIADEVQTGFGRTGRLFACEHEGVEPDLLVTAKSLAAGLPLAAVVGRAELMDGPIEGGLGGTYGGNPLACAAAHAVLDLFESGELLRRSESIGAQIEARAREWARSSALIGDIRRLGAMVGLELVVNRETREPAKHETEDIVRLAYQRGVLLIPSGTFGNVIRFLTPLSIADDELREGLDVLASCFQSLPAHATAR
ncbi:MAG TPA: 4-aminobutyrate--2-oxoglutarate transaminase [Vicinamibacterales bacterium]|jgi:4-aminobutyrate aminotransferase/(S)-3-amino-2-methylpropionate transaminase